MMIILKLRSNSSIVPISFIECNLGKNFLIKYSTYDWQGFVITFISLM